MSENPTHDFEGIATEIVTQDNASTCDPYFLVFEGNPNRSARRLWRFRHAFLTRAAAQAYIDGHRYDLRSPFIWVESAHDNHEIRAARAAITEVARLRAEVRSALERLGAGSSS